MLISLSSHTETNPARFSNYFSTPTIVKPFSYVCLIQAGLIRNKDQKQATVPPDFQVNIRFNAYNIHQLVLNAGGQNNLLLNITQLVAALNTARPAVANQQVDGFYEFVVSQNQGYAFELKFFNQELNPFAKDHIYGANGNNYVQQYWNLIGGDNDTVPTSQNQNNRQNIPAVATTWGLGVAWDETFYTPPTNQANRNTPTIMISQNPAYNNDQFVSTFCLANNNVNGKITVGHATTNTANPPIYTSGPFEGSANDGYDNRKLDLTFDAVRGLDISVFNKATNNLELVNEGVQVNPGDRFLILPTNTTTPQPTGTDDLGHYSIVAEFSKRLVYMYVGIMGEIANRPAGANYLLSTNQVSPTDQNNSSNMSYVYDDASLRILSDDQTTAESQVDFLALFNGNNNALWTGNSVIGICAGTGQRQALGNNYVGVNAGWIYDQSLGRPATFPFLNSGETQIASAQIRNATGCWGFNTFADGVARASTQVEIPNVFRIQQDVFRFNCPTMIQVHTCFGDTAGMYVAGDLLTSHRVLFAENQSSAIVVALQNTEAWDVEWFMENRNPLLPKTGLQLVLADGAGARINVRPSTLAGDSYNYTWWFQYFGDRANVFSVRVYCNEQTRTAGGVATNVLYSTAITPCPANTQQPRGINYMGGANPLDPFFIGGGGATQYRYFNMAENTLFSHFRIYQNSEDSDLTTTLWDTLFNLLFLNYQGDFTTANEQGLVPNNAGLPNTGYFMESRIQQLFPTPAQQAVIENYTSIPYPQPELTSTFMFRKTTRDGGNIGVGYHKLTGSDFANISVDNYITCPLGSTIKTLNASSYAGTGQGIVNPSADFETAIDVETPIVNPDGNYLQNQEYDPDEGVNHPLSTMELDLDVLDIPSEKLKVQLTNLPHNSINGATNSVDKTIYEVPLIENVARDNEHEIVEITAPTKCWIPLNNAGEIPLNQIDVRIAEVDNREATNLTKDTNIVIQIEDDIRLLN